MCITMDSFRCGRTVKKLMKKNIILSFTIFSLFSILQIAKADFGTLITTESERKIIDDNRYIVKKVKAPTTVAKVEIEKTKNVIYQTITNEYKISGISIANNGDDTAWINGELHENGDVLDEKITIRINASKRKVRFTVRGGKTYYGKSGDKVSISYKVPLIE